MNIDALLIQSLELLGLGMGSVFIILSLLIGVISLVSVLVPEDTPAPVGTTPSQPEVKTEHVAAILAAIHRYRNKN